MHLHTDVTVAYNCTRSLDRVSIRLASSKFERTAACNTDVAAIPWDKQHDGREGNDRERVRCQMHKAPNFELCSV